MSDPMKCPVCGGTDLAGERPIFDRVGNVQINACYRYMECENCGSEWTAIFTFSRAAAIINPSK